MNGIDFALLKFCLEHNDSPNVQESVLTERDPEDYAWLQKVMNSIPSPVEQMKKCIEILSTDPDEGAKINALELLQDLVEDIDIANGM